MTIRYVINGQVTLTNGKYWRIDDTEAARAPDYNPIELLKKPFGLLSCDLTTVNRLVRAMNESEQDLLMSQGGTDVSADQEGG